MAVPVHGRETLEQLPEIIIDYVESSLPLLPLPSCCRFQLIVLFAECSCSFIGYSWLVFAYFYLLLLSYCKLPLRFDLHYKIHAQAHRALSQYYYYCWFGCRFDFKINTKSHTDFFFSLLCGWTFACRSYWISLLFSTSYIGRIQYEWLSVYRFSEHFVVLLLLRNTGQATVIQSTYIVRCTRAK